MQKGKANVIIDGQWGSTGKGKLSGYLALRNTVDVVSCDFMPNAGHTFVDDEGKKLITRQLPTSLVNGDAMILINPGAAIDVGLLMKEIEEFGVSGRIMIHPHASIVTSEDKQAESDNLKKIASTLKGCGSSLSRKIMRSSELAGKHSRLKEFIGNTTSFANGVLTKGGTVLIEGAQGFDLSLNHGNSYPYVTSRDVTTMSILNNAGVPPVWLGDVYGCLRTYPIRVGNHVENGEMIGTSGNYYDDQKELDWEYITAKSGSVAKISETTTVTGKTRRVFTFSLSQLYNFVNVCAPNKLFVNFVNYIDSNDYEVKKQGELSALTKNWLTWLQGELFKKYPFKTSGVSFPQISLAGTGEKDSDMVEICL